VNIDLAAIEERASAATEGPWEAQNLERDHGHRGIYWVSVDRPDEIKTVAEVDANDDGIEAIWRMADAEFIAHARTDVPALLALVREQQAKLDAVRDLAEEWESLGSRHPLYAHFAAYQLRAAITAKEATQ